MHEAGVAMPVDIVEMPNERKSVFHGSLSAPGRRSGPNAEEDRTNKSCEKQVAERAQAHAATAVRGVFLNAGKIAHVAHARRDTPVMREKQEASLLRAMTLRR
ncbi:hypothetical protein [Methylosinus sporium]|uniref:hypothetical protein n=1 Tax=Methylosinus sporium TaxID=428 RepID=UPI001304DE5D|nr:hypothetical protein [Methylosinus sporium]